MTNPSDPGQPQRPPAPGGPAGPYGPPPQPHPGNIPSPRPAAPGPTPAPDPRYQPPQQEWAPGPRAPREKGLLAALLDLNFDYMVTAKLFKIIYSFALLIIGIDTIVMAWYGVAFFEWNPALALMTLIATPFACLFQLVVTRMVLEFLINQFKISEYLRIIKDKI